jgi:hypothetical protein
MHHVVRLRVDTLTNATPPGYLGLNSRVTAPYNACAQLHLRRCLFLQ